MPWLMYVRCDVPLSPTGDVPCQDREMSLGHLLGGGETISHRRGVPLEHPLTSMRRLADPQKRLIPIRALSSHEVSHCGPLWIPELIVAVFIQAESTVDIASAFGTSWTRRVQIASNCFPFVNHRFLSLLTTSFTLQDCSRPPFASRRCFLPQSAQDTIDCSVSIKED
jgi:hypothetical protein